MADPSEEEIMRYLAVDLATAAREQSKPFDAKKTVWVPKKGLDGFIAVEVVSASGDDITVKNLKTNEELQVKKDKCEQMNPPKYEKCADMANLTYLNEASVLYNLRSRYTATLIYTYSGLFCIAVNPYRRLPIYNDTCIKMFRGKRKIEMPPHVFAIVDSAYQDMLQDHENQSMLITGESGAGKTENTKKVIMYIAKVAGVEKKPDAKPSAGEEGHKIKGSLDEQIVEANPLMESFGNAKTVRNNNSSRFGKFIRAHFSQTGKLAGADIESYLLEKNRVTFQLAAERNYHIFYQLLYATSDEYFASLCLPSRESKDYAYLEKGVPHVDRIDDHEEYGLTENAIVVLGFTPDERNSMFRIVAAILNLCNVKLKERKEQAEILSPEEGERCSFLLGLNVTEFHKSLVKPKVKVGTSFVNKGQTMNQVTFGIAALSKVLYERMFLWQVVRINKALDTKERRSYFIGVLDIAGFEIFEYNSFDQLCINLTNEKLQQFFNHTMFVLEQEEYKKEGLIWESIDFGMDLEKTIDLIEKPKGIFAILEEECIVPKASDKSYLEKLHATHAGKHPSYAKPSTKAKGKDGDFILHHYAGSVGYSVAGWLEKNKDPINENSAGLLALATDALVASLFQDYNPNAGTRRKGSAFQTVSYNHREKLKVLLATLGDTSPHFVRCIIPNETKSPGEIDGDLVLHQLRCNGVLEGIRICRKGFPSRMLFSDFRQRYQILASSAIPGGFIDGKVACEKLIEALQLDESEYRIGMTKVFFRAGILGELEDMRDERLSKIISQFQAYCKGHLMRVEYQKMTAKRVGVAVIQRNVRKYFALRNWPWWKLYIMVQPLLGIARAEEDMKEKEEELRLAKEQAEQDAKSKAEMELKVTEVIQEKERLFKDLNQQTDSLVKAEEQLMSVQVMRDSLEKSLNEALERLDEEEHAAGSLGEEKREALIKITTLTEQAEERDTYVGKIEGEKVAQAKHIEGLQGEIVVHEEAFAKISHEKQHVEATLSETVEALQTAEDKGKKLSKEKASVESNLAESEANLAREVELKVKVDKEKKKVEATLRDTETKLGETEASFAESQDTIAKRDKSIKEADEKAVNQDALIKQLQKRIAELLARVDELEEELDAEKKNRIKVERAKAEISSELDALGERLEESSGANTQQVEVSKKKDAEIGKLKKEMEDATAANDAAAASQKKKFHAMLDEAAEEYEALKKSKSKSDKEKAASAAEAEDLQSQLDAAKKKAAVLQKQVRATEDKLKDANDVISGLEVAVAEAAAKPSGTVDAATLAAATEDIEHKLGMALKTSKLLQGQLDESVEFAEAETKAKQDAQYKLKGSMDEIDSLTEQLDEESAAKAAMQSKFSKASAEAAEWKNKYAVEGASKVEELEFNERKLATRVAEMEEALAAAENKASGMEKVKNRMNEEVEDLLLDLEKAQAQASNLDKKQKKVDSQIAEWKMKCDDVNAELDNAQRDARNNSTELLKARASLEEANDKNASLKKENRALSDEISSMGEQLSSGGKTSIDAEKARRKAQMETEEIQVALEEVEGALEAEEAKFLKCQLELSAFRQAAERKSAEKDQEHETLRGNHARQIESLQSMIDAAGKAASDATKNRKKQDEQIADLQSALELCDRNSGDYQRQIKKLELRIKEIGVMMDDASAGNADIKETATRSERRVVELTIQIDEIRNTYETSVRSNKLLLAERQELSDRIVEMQNMYNNLAAAKRKTEGDFQSLQEEIYELENDKQISEEKSAKGLAEVARLMAELAFSHESAAASERSRLLMSKAVVEANARADEAEAAGGKKLINTIRKLESRIMELEGDLDTETRKANEAMKGNRKIEKANKDLRFQVEDEQKAAELATYNAEQINQKMKKMRCQLEDAELAATSLQAKYRKIFLELEESEERRESAELAMQKARQRGRTGGTVTSHTRTIVKSGSVTPRIEKKTIEYTCELDQ